MIVLAFRLVWAIARLVVQLSWRLGVLVGHAIIAIVRCASTHRLRPRTIALGREADDR